MDDPLIRLILDRAGERARAREAVAASHPPTWLLFAKDNRVEDLAVERLHTDRAAAALRQIVQPHLDFKRFLPQVLHQGNRGGEVRSAINDQAGLFLSCS